MSINYAIVAKHHRTICPNLFHEEDLELFRDPVQYVQDNFDITKEEAVDIARNYSELGAQMTLYLDFDCKKKVDWCKAHPEVQGRYIDPDEDVFTYEEFAKCQNFYEEWVIGLPPWSETGMPCDFFNYEDDECPYGFCALRNYGTSYSELNTTDYICCNSMERIEYFDESQNTIVAICSNQELER